MPFCVFRSISCAVASSGRRTPLGPGILELRPTLRMLLTNTDTHWARLAIHGSHVADTPFDRLPRPPCMRPQPLSQQPSTPPASAEATASCVTLRSAMHSSPRSRPAVTREQKERSRLSCTPARRRRATDRILDRPADVWVAGWDPSARSSLCLSHTDGCAASWIVRCLCCRVVGTCPVSSSSASLPLVLFSRCAIVSLGSVGLREHWGCNTSQYIRRRPS